MLNDALVENRKSLMLRGLAGIAFGLVAFFLPFVTLAGLVLMFGAYAFLDGALAIAAAVHPKRDRRHAFLLLEGVVGIGIGVAAILWTGVTAMVLTSLVAFWAVVTGALEIAMGAHLGPGFPGRRYLLAVGIMSLVFGMSVILFPAAGALGIVFLLGAYAMTFGVTLLLLAWDLRRLAKKSAEPMHGRFAVRSA